MAPEIAQTVTYKPVFSHTHCGSDIIRLNKKHLKFQVRLLFDCSETNSNEHKIAENGKVILKLQAAPKRRSS